MKKSLHKISKSNINQLYNINKNTNNLAIVFGPQDTLFKDLAIELRNHDPNLYITGLGTSNCFIGDETGGGDELVMALLQLEKTKIHSVCLHNKNYESTEDTARDIARFLMNKSSDTHPLSAVLLFTEGLNINGAALTRPFEDLNIPVCGGLASEIDFAFKKTQIFYDLREYQNCISAVGFYGKNFTMDSYAAHGMKPFGVFKKITKSEKNALIEVDGAPAVDWYLSYLFAQSDIDKKTDLERKQLISELSQKALAYPIQIYPPGEKDIEGCIRTPIGFNSPGLPHGSVLFTGEIPEGHSLKMMLANPQEVIEGADESVLSLQNKANDNSLFIHLSCSARQLFLQSLVNFEYASARNCIGAYVYGEITTLSGQKPSLANQTFTSIKFTED